jgi:hypothetical protein
VEGNALKQICLFFMCVQLMLGATLSKGPGRCCPPLRVVLGVTLARLLLLPLLGTGWLLLASRAGETCHTCLGPVVHLCTMMGHFWLHCDKGSLHCVVIIVLSSLMFCI